ncbi:MAG: S-methyl-5-thioribose-1-phosphate isomerase [Candidatus Eiseniibacteriota bacterium]
MSVNPGSAVPALSWNAETGALEILDQTLLPHEVRRLSLTNLEEVCEAIKTMRVRGAPLIGIAGAFGLALALCESPGASPDAAERAGQALVATRPTAVNLAWAVGRVRAALESVPARDSTARAARALAEAEAILEEEIATCSRIGDHGLAILERLRSRGGRAGGRADERLNVLTHCNAGWLATGGWGTALAPVYKAHAAGLPIHVWVDETRPRGQGASLTTWELGQAGIPHTLIADTASGHQMQRGRVDVVFVGSDRTTARGDVCNKIGTYLVALAARANEVPFYAAVPTSSIDWTIEDGLAGIPIEERDPTEVRQARGRLAGATGAAGSVGAVRAIDVSPDGTTAANPAFDVTPAPLVTGIVTEHGVFSATREGLAPLRAIVESGSRA